jgi:hypothetical protein
MIDATSFNPHKEEDDEGYLGAAAGLSILDNPYPYGTIRHEDWRRGWQAKSDEVRRSVRMGKEQG